MSNLFSSVQQLAGFLIEGSQGKVPGQMSAESSKDVFPDFQTFLKLAVNSRNSQNQASLGFPFLLEGEKQPNNAKNSEALFTLSSGFNKIRLNPGVGSFPKVETKERVSINPQILKVILANQKDTIKITLPTNFLEVLTQGTHTQLNQIVAQSIIPQLSNIESQVQKRPVTGIDQKPAGVVSEKGPSQSDIISSNEFTLTVDISKLFENQTGDKALKIPVTIGDSKGTNQQEMVDVSAVLDILANYSDPIEVEISNVNEKLMSVSDALSKPESIPAKSSFVFDLRDLAKTVIDKPSLIESPKLNDLPPAKPIMNQPLPENPAFENEASVKTPLAETPVLKNTSTIKASTVENSFFENTPVIKT
jgi:hypothetical protein